MHTDKKSNTFHMTNNPSTFQLIKRRDKISIMVLDTEIILMRIPFII